MAEPGPLDGRLRRLWRETAEAGAPLPPEEGLVDLLGASRSAVRDALLRLEADGLISRHRGAGTFVNTAALDVPVRLDRAEPIAERIAAAGYDPAFELLSSQVLDATAAEGLPTRLNVPAGTTVLRTAKRWLADGMPTMHAVDVIPLRRLPSEADDDLRATMVELAARIGFGQADWLCSWTKAVVAEGEVAEALAVVEGTALLRIEQVGVERHGSAVFHSLEHHRSDILEYGIIRTIAL